MANKEDGEIEVFNSPRVLFLELDFIKKENLDFEDFLKKYSIKEMCGDLLFFSLKESKTITFPAIEAYKAQRYKQVLEKNNIKSGYIEEKLFGIPPDFFLELDRMYSAHEKLKDITLGYLSNLFSLFIIAEKTDIVRDDRGVKFVFTIYVEGENPVILDVRWQEWDFFEKTETCFSMCYEWLTNKSDFDLETRLKVVREYIKMVGNFYAKAEWVNSFESILNRIMKNEVNTYFHQQNKLKDEFIVYKKMEMESRSRLMKNLLALIVGLSLAYYARIFNLKNFHVFQSNMGLAIVFGGAMIAIVFLHTLFMSIIGKEISIILVFERYI